MTTYYYCSRPLSSLLRYIITLLIFAFYIFAILGYYLFAANDPVHFGGLVVTMLTLFQCATLSTWMEVFYINKYGCDEFDGGIYHPGEKVRYFQTMLGRFADFTCADPSPSPIAAPLYFAIFTMLTAWVSYPPPPPPASAPASPPPPPQVILSLFVGVITMGMLGALHRLNEAKKAACAAAKKKSIAKEQEKARESSRRLFEANKDLVAAGVMQAPAAPLSREEGEMTPADRSLKHLMTQAMTGTMVVDTTRLEFNSCKAYFESKCGEAGVQWYLSTSAAIKRVTDRDAVRALWPPPPRPAKPRHAPTHHPAPPQFGNLIMALVVLTSVLVAVSISCVKPVLLPDPRTAR